jgi:hypothetical protein
MGLSVSCVNCHRTVKVKSKLAGKTVRCPRCGSPVSVPAARAEEPSLDRPSQARATPAPPSRRSSHEMAQRGSSKSDAGQRVSGRTDADQRLTGKRDSGNFNTTKSGSGKYAATRGDSGKSDTGQYDAKSDTASHKFDDNDEAYVPRLKRRRGPNVIATALVGAWESLGDRRREYAVGLAIVAALVALQLVYGGWFSSKPSGPPVSAAQDSNDNDEPPAKKGPVSVVIVDSEKKKDDADKEGDKDAEAKAVLKRTAPVAGKDTAAKDSGLQKTGGRMVGGKRPSASVLGARQDPQRTLQPPESTSHAQSTIPTVKTDHAGAYTAAAPPEVGEVVVVRLRDGLHVAKVAGIDISELQCEIIVLDVGAYHKRGQIKETSRTDTVRFGQMRPPAFLRNRALPQDFGPPAM